MWHSCINTLLFCEKFGKILDSFYDTMHDYFLKWPLNKKKIQNRQSKILQSFAVRNFNDRWIPRLSDERFANWRVEIHGKITWLYTNSGPEVGIRAKLYFESGEWWMKQLFFRIAKFEGLFKSLKRDSSFFKHSEE